jgi:diguanylate cyclase (GGDEF)-like protein/PAS domain S-box-containing protein
LSAEFAISALNQVTIDTAVNVLLVEDDNKSARHIEGITRRETPFNVTRVRSLAEAEQALQQSSYALALLSLELNAQPGLSAYALLQAIAPQLPIVVLAADDDETLALKTVHQGAADYLIRSQIYSTMLVRSLKHAIEYSRAEAGKREAMAALTRSELRYRALFEQSRDAIFLTDKNGLLVETNAAMREMFKCTRAELHGRSVTALFADEADAPVFEEQFAVRNELRDFEVRVRGRGNSELWVLLSLAPRPDTNEGLQGILHDITDRKHFEQRLVHDAYHDVLTGLPNRALFIDRLDHALVRWQGHHHERFAVLFVDLNRFKVINDSLGHSAGDELLRRVGKIMVNCVRAEDTVARLGGDEYAVLIERLESNLDPIIVAQRIHSSLERPLEVAGQAVYVSCSIGIALPDSDADKAEDMLRNADLAMYKSKAVGPATHTVYVPGMHTHARHLMELDMDLNQAVRAGEFALHYQPIYDLQKGGISGFEALVRWNHPRRGLMLPHEFLPLAEETGLIVPIGSWVIEEVCGQLAKWRQAFPNTHLPFVSLNVSGTQITKPDFVRELGRALRRKRVPANALMLELTETSLLQNPDTCAATITKLRSAGVRICIDDFGTGYSSLSYLHRLPINGLKIDRSFIATLEQTDGSEMVSTIIALAHSLGLYAVAEGVETEQQLARVRKFGPRYVQGFYLSRPVDPPSAQKMLIGAA